MKNLENLEESGKILKRIGKILVKIEKMGRILKFFENLEKLDLFLRKGPWKIKLGRTLHFLEAPLKHS